jgi:hypothetical protein
MRRYFNSFAILHALFQVEMQIQIEIVTIITTTSTTTAETTDTQKLRVFKLVQKFLVYETRMFKQACQWTLLWATTV